MITLFQSKLGKTLGGILGYVPNLVVGSLSLVSGVLFQRFFWLDLTWGVLGTAIGTVGGLVMLLLGGEVRPAWGRYVTVRAPAYFGNVFGAVSLGPVLIGNHTIPSSVWRHEYGHTWQSRILGPIYPFIVGLPSLISAAAKPSGHASFYTERWADSWSSWP